MRERLGGLAGGRRDCTLSAVKNTTDDTDTIIPDLRRMADEVRVRIHLASLDAKDAWSTLESKIHDLEHKAQQATGRAKEQITDLAALLKRELADLLKRLPPKEPETARSR